jgi:predicted transcriptional regulator
MDNKGANATIKETKDDHQAQPSRNSWDLPNSYEVKAPTYLIRSVQAAGAARLVNEVANQRLKVTYGVPWWP